MDHAQEFSAPDRFPDRVRLIAAIVGSVNALAKQSGLSQPTVRQYLLGSDPSRAALRKLSHAAGVSFAWLGCGEGPICSAQSPLAEKARKALSDVDPPAWAAAVLRSLEAHGLAENPPSAESDLSRRGRLLLSVARCASRRQGEQPSALAESAAAAFDLLAGEGRFGASIDDELVNAALVVALSRRRGGLGRSAGAAKR